MKIQTRLTTLSILTLFILTGIINSINGDPGLSVDSSNTSSIALKVEVGSETLDASKDVELSSSTQRVYPVYPQTRSNGDNYSKVTIKGSGKDSYLDALEHSHSNKKSYQRIVGSEIKPKISKVIRRIYDSPVYRPATEYGPPREPASTYGLSNSIEGTIKNPRIVSGSSGSPGSFFPSPSDLYSLPIQQSERFNEQNPYGTGQISYGPPQISYAVPSTNYGPAPAPQDVYRPPQTSYLPQKPPQQGYETQGWNGYQLPPLAALPSIDFSWPFALKLNFFTIAKILLKLVIFKMIVKFIAVICLLLFIPKLELKKGDKDDDSDDDGRKMRTSDSTLEQLNTLTSVVLDAIEMYRGANGSKNNDMEEKCSNNSCRILRFLKSGDGTWRDYFGLFQNYVHEEEMQKNDNPPEEKT